MPRTRQADYRPPRRRGRALWWIVGILVLLAVLWVGYWFAANRIASAAVGKAVEGLAAGGRTLTCTTTTSGGFPLSLDVDCQSPRFADSGGVSLSLGGASARAPLWWPGSVNATLTGPFTLEDAARGLSVGATWAAGLAGVDAGLGGLNGGHAAFDQLKLTAQGGGAPLATLAAARAEANAGSAGTNSYRFRADGTGLVLTLADGRTMPTFDGAVDITAVNFGETLGSDPREAFTAWLTGAGGGFKLEALTVTAGDVAATATGVGILHEDGLLSADLTVRLRGLNRLPDLLESIRPGSRERSARTIAAVSMLTRPVDGDPGGREIPLTIRRGTVSVGVIPVATIPPIQF